MANIDKKQQNEIGQSGLTKEEAEEFNSYDGVIKNHLHSVFDAGEALEKVQRKKLCRPLTFEQCCIGQWGISRSYAYQLIDAAKVKKQLSTIVDKDGIPAPENECQVRPLSGLDDDKVMEAWKLAAKKADEGRITGELVKKAVSEVLNEKPTVNQLDRFLKSFDKVATDVEKAADNAPPQEWDQNVKIRFKQSLKPILRIAVEAGVLDAESVGLNVDDAA